MFHTLLLTKTVVHALCHIEEHNHCFMHYFGVKTLSETLFSPPLMHPGDGARQPALEKKRADNEASSRELEKMAKDLTEAHAFQDRERQMIQDYAYKVTRVFIAGNLNS